MEYLHQTLQQPNILISPLILLHISICVHPGIIVVSIRYSSREDSIFALIKDNKKTAGFGVFSEQCHYYFFLLEYDQHL